MAADCISGHARGRVGKLSVGGHPQFLIWWVWTRRILVRIKWVEALFSNNVRFFRQMTFMTFVVFKYICQFYNLNDVLSFSDFDSFYNMLVTNNFLIIFQPLFSGWFYWLALWQRPHTWVCPRQEMGPTPWSLRSLDLTSMGPLSLKTRARVPAKTALTFISTRIILVRIWVGKPIS